MDLSRPKVPVTITFSVPGTLPPVFVASSLTTPSWEPIEMSVKDERTASGDLIFEKNFDAVESGEYQYKFRLGPGDWWVCDESAPIVCDDAGNRNNLLLVTPLQSPALDKGGPRSTSSAPEIAAEDATTSDKLKDGEGGRSHSDPAPAPLPFTVVETVPDAEQPVYGGKRPASLGGDASKRAADAEPDGEFESPEANSSPVKPDTQNDILVPSVVIEKTDDEPAHGDDLGANATQGQQDAHEKRAADAEPDKVVVTGDVEEPKELSRLKLVPESELPAETSTMEDQHSPLLPHEELEPLSDDEAPLLPHERSTSVSNAGSEAGEDAITAADFAPVEFDGDMPLFRHESISVSAVDSPPRSPSQSQHKSHTSLKDMMDDEDINDPSIEPFPTRRETIYEHLQTLASRREVDIALPEDIDTSPRRKTSRSSSELIPPASPLDSIKETEESEGEDVDELPSRTIPEPVVERPIPAVPTPPLTPKDDGDGKRHDRADSLVTVTGEEHSRDAEGQSDGTDGTKGLSNPEPPSANLEPSAASAEVDRPSTSHSAKVTPNKQNSSFMIKFWNNLFGSWLGPVLHRLLTLAYRVLALAIGTAIVAYSYQSTLLGTAAPSYVDQ
ncbi:hypothetical protein SLS58_010374 [Diplodia intermedia]|uniref:AMP-activated protein kinase glycogen-binding domain-containing protein n=1 Tax=Diplodia intermedia TaxID=856260 RepID=A0ABR3T6J8_9PEZI